MAGYIARRVGYLVPTWLGITLLAFVLSTLAPGDPAASYFQRQHGRLPSQAELEATRQQLGLDRSLVEQYLSFLTGAVRGDLGTSFASGRPVTTELLDRFPATLQLAGAAIVIALLIAIPLGVLAAARRNTLLDQLTRAGAIVAASVPSFWLALLLIILFSVKLGWLPSFGHGDIRHLILPAIALALGEAAIMARLTRSSLLEVLGEDYLNTARAKGIAEWWVILRHGLRNALVAVVTQASLLFGFLLATSAIVEVIFVWPGIGRLAVDAIGGRDYPVIAGYVVFTGTVFVLLNLLVDLLYLKLDPRVRLGPAAVARGR